jgi:hypothetical protein
MATKVAGNEEGDGARAMATATKRAMATDGEDNVDDGKRDGDGNEVGKGKSGKSNGYGNKEGNGDSSKIDGDSNEEGKGGKRFGDSN